MGGVRGGDGWKKFGSGLIAQAAKDKHTPRVSSTSGSVFAGVRKKIYFLAILPLEQNGNRLL